MEERPAKKQGDDNNSDEVAHTRSAYCDATTPRIGFQANFLTSLPYAHLAANRHPALLLQPLFMTFAWYGHLKTLNGKPWLIAALISWGIAFFEYMLMVPANRIGYTELSIGQLKIMQEVVTLAVFVPFSVLYMQQPLKLDYLWAGLCLVGAVYFIFRS